LRLSTLQPASSWKGSWSSAHCMPGTLLAAEVVEDLEAAIEQPTVIAEDLRP